MTPDELIAIRKGMGLSRVAFAKRLGVSESRLMDLERGVVRGSNRARNPTDARDNTRHTSNPRDVPLLVALAAERLVENHYIEQYYKQREEIEKNNPP